MTIIESLAVALFVIIVVFALLACVYILILLSSALIQKVEKIERKHKILDTQESKIIDFKLKTEDLISSGSLKLTNVDDATAAMIMAIVSDESGVPLSELHFKSIRLIEPNKN